MHQARADRNREQAMNDPTVGVMVCGHGSRDEDAIREFHSVARGVRERLPHYDVESAFLEFARPVLARRPRQPCASRRQAARARGAGHAVRRRAT